MTSREEQVDRSETDADDGNLSRGNELVGLGDESLSAVAGATAGSVRGPPGTLAGAAAGPALTRVLRWAGKEIRNRVLSPNEERRIGGALGVALDRIQERLDAGEEPRTAGLFDPGSDPNGLLEGSMLTAARSYEEQKVPYIGAFYANLVFDESVSAVTAQLLLGLLDRLTFRQLCALAFLGEEDRAEQRMQIQARANEQGDATSPTLSAELGDLANQGLIGYRQDDGSTVNPL